MMNHPWKNLWRHRTLIIAILAIAAIAMHLVLRFAIHSSAAAANIPLFATFVFSGTPLIFELLGKLWKAEFVYRKGGIGAIKFRPLEAG